MSVSKSDNQARKSIYLKVGCASSKVQLVLVNEIFTCATFNLLVHDKVLVRLLDLEDVSPAEPVHHVHEEGDDNAANCAANCEHHKKLNKKLFTLHLIKEEISRDMAFDSFDVELNKIKLS